jgi:hypothetical protein
MENTTNNKIHKLRQYILKARDLVDDIESDILKLNIDTEFDYTNEGTIYQINKHIDYLKSILMHIYNLASNASSIKLDKKV